MFCVKAVEVTEIQPGFSQQCALCLACRGDCEIQPGFSQQCALC